MESTFLTLGVALIVVGLLLLAADLFVTSGILFVLALSSIIVGLVFLFKHDTVIGVYGLVTVFIVTPTMVGLLLRISPLRRLVHAPQDDTPAQVTPDLHELKGRIGRTISAMKPGGAIDFDGRRVDGATEGMMLGPGQLVRCIAVRGREVIVRPVRESDNNVDDLEIAQL
jgi:membrane-bound serine protease (ClpP class)